MKKKAKDVHMQPDGLGNTRKFNRLCSKLSPDTEWSSQKKVTI